MTEKGREIERPLLELVTELARSLHPGYSFPELHLDSDLEKDAGLDSLGRVELMLRIRRRFRVEIADEQAVEARTPGDLLKAIEAAGPATEVTSEVTVDDVESGDGEPVEPSDAATLAEVLDWHADRVGDRQCLTLYEPGGDLSSLSYQQLREASAELAAGLRERGLGPGDRVALMLPTGLDFFFAFHGVLRAGGVPVPLYPPVRISQVEDHFRRIARVVENAQAAFFIASTETVRAGQLLMSLAPGLSHVLTADQLREGMSGIQRVPRRQEEMAFLQYTSGTTGDPKGVILSHANLLANIRAMGGVVGASPDDRFVSWLPLYHDMGLIGACLGTLYYGIPLYLMSPLQFMARPQRWLWAIHRHGGTLSAAPNFAYDLCANRLRDEDLEGLDLSSWRVAFNGAEPVSPKTLEVFQKRFSPYGFGEKTMKPVYGLAESSVGLTFPPMDRAPRFDRIDRDAFQRRGEARPAAEEAPDARLLVACGRALPGHEIRVVDERNRPLPDRRQGHLQFRGPSCTRGYFRNPDATSDLFHDGWLNSGDLAYLDDGELYLTGRVKDMIIRGGRNFYPYELEQAVSAIAGVRRNNVAVFASRGDDSGPEKLVVVAETRERDVAEQERIREAIIEASMSFMESAPDVISLQPPESIPKTSSGKIRRPACRELFESGQLGQRVGLWRQMAHLMGSGLLPTLRRSLNKAGRGLFATWAWLTAILLLVPASILLLVMPGRGLRAAIARGATRSVLLLTGMGPTIRGLNHLPEGPCVVVVNHASYLDGPLMRASLPGPLYFIAKRELAGTVLGHVLRRVGALWVERFDHRKGLEDLERAIAHLANGERLLFFPEGTLAAAPGLRSFRIGAFMAAVRCQVPVVAVAVRGSRRSLRGYSFLPRPSRIEVDIGPPMAPDGDGWEAAIELRDRSRAWLLAHCEEPDIGGQTTSLFDRDAGV
ncbi:AMP-binding protein [Natronospira bacteriovora]|uniref:AMP-binding protein n=1 Tax=Natronospira bacteriovora TaxID=3069753 RepID=A0ABU0W4T1_9GAMM|nr:AMP-binding protein [Natronospira sp. AB-CW4]MDQ2069022.1 AMP-binding protein [Natronospira sp. AB-CW4]